MADLEELAGRVSLLPGKPTYSPAAAEHNRRRYPDLMARLDRLEVRARLLSSSGEG